VKRLRIFALCLPFLALATISAVLRQGEVLGIAAISAGALIGCVWASTFSITEAAGMA
jgi:hypothetical protein